MSSGTGKETSQNSGIGLRINYGWGARAEGSGRACPSLGVWFLRLQAEILHHHLQIFPRLAFLSRVAQQVRGVVGDCKARAGPCRIVAACARGFEIVKAAAQL